MDVGKRKRVFNGEYNISTGLKRANCARIIADLLANNRIKEQKNAKTNQEYNPHKT